MREVGAKAEVGASFCLMLEQRRNGEIKCTSKWRTPALTSYFVFHFILKNKYNMLLPDHKEIS
jgi:hypothetical protein